MAGGSAPGFVSFAASAAAAAARFSATCELPRRDTRAAATGESGSVCGFAPAAATTGKSA